MTLRLARSFPISQKMWPQFARRMVAWTRDRWKATCAPPWNEAVAATWWRSAGHARSSALREPGRWISRAVVVRNAWWLRTLRFAHVAETNGRPERLWRRHSTRAGLACCHGGSRCVRGTEDALCTTSPALQNTSGTIAASSPLLPSDDRQVRSPLPQN